MKTLWNNETGFGDGSLGDVLDEARDAGREVVVVSEVPNQRGVLRRREVYGIPGTRTLGFGEVRRPISDRESGGRPREVIERRIVSIRTYDSDSYRRGYRTSMNAVESGALDRADGRNEPIEWYDGYLDAAAGREKYHLRSCRSHGPGPDGCGEA